MNSITPDMIRAQYAKNAKQLRAMAEQAAKTPGKKYRGKTAAEWDAVASRYENLAKGIGTIGRI